MLHNNALESKGNPVEQSDVILQAKKILETKTAKALTLPFQTFDCLPLYLDQKLYGYRGQTYGVPEGRDVEMAKLIIQLNNAIDQKDDITAKQAHDAIDEAVAAMIALCLLIELKIKIYQAKNIVRQLLKYCYFDKVKSDADSSRLDKLLENADGLVKLPLTGYLIKDLQQADEELKSFAEETTLSICQQKQFYVADFKRRMQNPAVLQKEVMQIIDGAVSLGFNARDFLKQKDTSEELKSEARQLSNDIDEFAKILKAPDSLALKMESEHYRFDRVNVNQKKLAEKIYDVICRSDALEKEFIQCKAFSSGRSSTAAIAPHVGGLSKPTAHKDSVDSTSEASRREIQAPKGDGKADVEEYKYSSTRPGKGGSCSLQ